MLVKRRHSRPIPEGAAIFEDGGRRYARWRTPSGKSLTRPLNRRGDRIVAESDCWYVRFRSPETGKWKEWRAYTDRQASQAREMEILKRLERGEAGLADPLAEHRRAPLEKHLEDFESYLEDKGNTSDHVDKTVARCKRIVREVEAKIAGDLTIEAIDRALATLRRGGMSVSTSNGYFRAIRTFCRWLVRAKRVRENPLFGMSCLKVTDADRKRRRRSLSPEEVTALVTATEQSTEPFMGLSGRDRAMLYIIAVNTGLRASELASLTPQSFELNAEMPVVRCQAGYTKNGAEAVQPLRRDVATMLGDWLADKPGGQPVWPGKWASQRHGAEMIKIDLSNANVDYEDATKRVADFHALRHTFISNLARAGVHPRNAQALARHSTIDLTMNVYTHVEMSDLAGDVENLPAVLNSSQTPLPAHLRVPEALPCELANLAESWSVLPGHIRRAIAALVKMSLKLSPALPARRNVVLQLCQELSKMSLELSSF
jgi:site-specific recombinase XerD